LGPKYAEANIIALLDALLQAYISYGQLANENLAVRYGFVERNNTNDAYVLNDMLGLLMEHDAVARSLTQAQITQLRQSGAFEVCLVRSAKRTQGNEGGGINSKRVWGCLPARRI
jgi:hypothetical protein